MMAYKNFKLTEFIEEIGSELRSARTAKKLTILGVVQALSTPALPLSSTMLGRIETGERRIDDNLFILLCNYYEINPYDLIERAAKKHIESLASFRHSGQENDATLESSTKILTADELYQLYQNLNTTGKEEIGTLLRMMGYMKIFQS